MQSKNSETWKDIIEPPICANAALLKREFESADGSTSVRAIVCSGSFLGSESRACRAASFADLNAASGSGEGKGLEGCLAVVGGSGTESPSSYTTLSGRV